MNAKPSIWIRVSKAAPCPICHKPDWCTGNGEVACCMRVESQHPARNGGWMHRLAQPRPRFVPRWKPLPASAPEIDAAAIWQRWLTDTRHADVAALGARLGVAVEALEALGSAWAAPHAAWAFPMRDGSGRVIGIRLRADDGRKWAVRGSRQGIFIPTLPPAEVAFICEGPTDTAAAVALGLFALGRPSCNCGGELLRAACRRLGVQRVVMVADNDAPGLQGAARVAREIGLTQITICPPCKDLREYVKCGGTRGDIETMVKQQVWRFYDR